MIIFKLSITCLIWSLKDTTDDYLEQTKKVVMESEVLLRKILGALDLEILPPSEKIRA